MDITTEAGALFDTHPRLKNKALLLDITTVNSCAGSNLGNAARHVGKHLADTVEQKKNKYRGSFPATYSLLPLAVSTCGEVGSDDVHALIKELVPRRVEHRSDTHSNESQHLAEGTEVASLRRQFSFVLQQALSFRTRHAVASTRQLRSQGPVSLQAHRTEGVTGPEGQEGTIGIGGRIGVGGGNGDGNGVGGGNGNVNGHGDGVGAGTATGVEVNEGAQDGTGAGTGVETRRQTPDGNGDGNGDGSEDSSGDGNGYEDNGNKDRIGEGGTEAKKRKKPQNSCRRHVGNGGYLSGKRKKCRKERVGPVAANLDDLESKKEAGGGAQGTQGSSKNCTSRESVFPLSRLIRGFRNKYPLGRINASDI